MQVTGNEQFVTLAQFLPLLQAQDVSTPDVSTWLESAAYRVAILEGNASLARLLAAGLAAKSVRVLIYENLTAALQNMEADASDLLILDLDLEGVDGLALLAKLRVMQPSMRLLVVSGHAGVEQAVKALNQGADDYLMKPFSLLEMMARVSALRRRSEGDAHAPALPPGGLVLHRDQCRVTCNGQVVDLTQRESELLEFMMMNAGVTLSRATLSQRVWNMSTEANTNIVDVYVKYLRDKLETAYQAKLIRTVRGVGYVFQYQS